MVRIREEIVHATITGELPTSTHVVIRKVVAHARSKATGLVEAKPSAPFTPKGRSILWKLTLAVFGAAARLPSEYGQ